MAGHGARTPDTIGRRRWLILSVGLAAQTSSCAYLYGLPFLIPQLRATEHLSLAQTGVLVAAPAIGLVFTLVLWGAAADRYGERNVMALGLGLTGIVVLSSLGIGDLGLFGVGLGVAGACAASVNAANGRMVLGWFGARERGFAMGVRQMAQPLGVGLASITLPALGRAAGFRSALIFPAVLCLAVAALVLVIVIDPPRPAKQTDVRPGSPYRVPTLWRIHGASALLVVPQFVASTYALTYLVDAQGWDPVRAGQIVAIVQVGGAVGRLTVGAWSDRIGSRMRPMRQIAVTAALLMLAWALGDVLHSWIATVALVGVLIVSVTDNGLGFTATAERAGPRWAGRAMGMQNTGQNVMAALTAPVAGFIIGGSSYAVAFALTAICPALGAALIPVRGESFEPIDTRSTVDEVAGR